MSNAPEQQLYAPFARNHFGNICYARIKTKDEIQQSEKFYTIIDEPRESATNGEVWRQYGRTNFVMSPTAASVFGEEGEGGGINAVLRVGNRFIVTADNKEYWMPVGREKKPGERPEETVVRTLLEELKITGVSEDRIRPMGTFAYDFENGILPGVQWPKVTNVVYVELTMEEVAHIIPAGRTLDDHEATVIDTSECGLESGGLSMIMFATAKALLSLPTEYMGKKFRGHHRRTLYHAIGAADEIIEQYDVSYLNGTYKVVHPDHFQ